MFWIRKCSDFLLNNQNTAIDLQIDHPSQVRGNESVPLEDMGVQCTDQSPVKSSFISSDEQREKFKVYFTLCR